MHLRALIYMVLVISFVCEVEIQGRRSSSRRSWRSYRRRSRSVSYSSYHRKSGMSSSKLRYLFPTTASLGSIYIASSMQPHVHLYSYRDLRRYGVCEGYRSIVLNGTEKTYSYFLCPDSIENKTHVYCCSNKFTHEGYCCPIDKWSTIAGITLLVIAAIITVCGGALFLIRRCRNQRRNRCLRRPSENIFSDTVVDANTPLNIGTARSTPCDTPTPHIELQPLETDRARDIVEFAKHRLGEKSVEGSPPPPYPGSLPPSPFPSNS